MRCLEDRYVGGALEESLLVLQGGLASITVGPSCSDCPMFTMYDQEEDTLEHVGGHCGSFLQRVVSFPLICQGRTFVTTSPTLSFLHSSSSQNTQIFVMISYECEFVHPLLHC